VESLANFLSNQQEKNPCIAEIVFPRAVLMIEVLVLMTEVLFAHAIEVLHQVREAHVIVLLDQATLKRSTKSWTRSCVL
jgi:hypothetical protein